MEPVWHQLEKEEVSFSIQSDLIKILTISIAMRLCWKSRTPDNCFADEWVSNET